MSITKRATSVLLSTAILFGNITSPLTAYAEESIDETEVMETKVEADDLESSSI